MDCGEVSSGYLGEEPLKNHSVVIGLFGGRGVMWKDVLSILHHLVVHLKILIQQHEFPSRNIIQIRQKDAKQNFKLN